MQITDEKDIEKYFVKECHLANIYPIKFTDPNRNGGPDRLCLKSDGTAFFVEFKREDIDHLGPAQTRYRKFLHDMRFSVYFCNSKEIAQSIVINETL